MAGAFNNAWNFLKATPEQQLMGMRGSIPQALSRFPRGDISRAPFTGESMNMDREFGEDAGKRQMAEMARLRQEGMTGS